MKRISTPVAIAGVAGVLCLLATLTTTAGGSEPACTESMTEFTDVSIFGRKERAAENMTEQHAIRAADGWTFMDMEPYLENGDLEGFFLTYTRPAPCATPG